MKRETRQRLVRAALAALGLALAGALVVVSGVIPITASDGHWAVTAWFLDFTKNRSVATHSLLIEAPPLDDPGLVLKGAGHYETGCRPCHGSPVLQHPRIAAAMTPHPPDLATTAPGWDPEELYYIVRHGIKMTGMPAWPSAERHDEVWAVVAFLLELPRLDADGYRRLVHGAGPQGGAEGLEDTPPLGELSGPAGVPRAALENCARCHGVDGLGRGAGVFPRIAGQRRAYLEGALAAYAGGARHSGIMEPLAAGLEPREWAALAAYYARLRGSGPPADDGSGAPATGSIARGREIARRGLPAQGVPSCADCHGPSEHPRNPAYPSLAGQYPDYLLLQLRLFQEGRRGGSSYAHLMRHVAARLEEDQMRDLAAYYGSLAWHAD